MIHCSLTGQSARSRTGRISFIAARVLLMMVALVLAGATKARAADSNNSVDAQLALISAEVIKQLGKTDVDATRANAAAVEFTNALRPVLSQPLTEEQLNAVISSLAFQHYSLWYCYLDFTDLELRYYGVQWTEMIRAYVARKPMTSEETAILALQLDTIFAAAQSAMNRALDGRPDISEIPKSIEYGRSLLSRDLNDPLMPVMKRPFTQAEVNELCSWLDQGITKGIAQWVMIPEDKGGGYVRHALDPIITNLWAKIWHMQYTAPQLSPELMQQMREERHKLVTERGKRFDTLSDAEKEAEQARMENLYGKNQGATE